MWQVGRAHAAAVYPFVDGMSPPSGPYPTDALREEVIGLIAALHEATPTVSDLADRDDMAIRRDELDEALTELDVVWESGPFVDPPAACSPSTPPTSAADSRSTTDWRTR